MSIILNALKKSEQDRRVSQETALDNDTPEQIKPKQKTPGWLFFLVSINVFILFYFIWDFTKENNKPENIALESSHDIDIANTPVSKNQTINLAKIEPNQTISKLVEKQTTTNNPALDTQRHIKPKQLKPKQSNIPSTQSTVIAPDRKKSEAILALNKAGAKIEISENLSADLTNLQNNSTPAIKPEIIQTKPQTLQSINKTEPKQPIVSLNVADDVTNIEKKESTISKKPTINSTDVINSKDLQTRQLDIQINQAINKVPPNKNLKTKKSIIDAEINNKIDQNNSSDTQTKPLIKPTNRLKQQTSIKQIKKLPIKSKVFVGKPDQGSTVLLQNNKSDTFNINSENLDRPQAHATTNLVTNTKADSINNVNQPPFLSELDNKFIRKVPKIKINVYVYSKNKNKRFIMINMTKFVPGQELVEGMVLNEIRMNSIVVDYDNKTFQIKRK